MTIATQATPWDVAGKLVKAAGRSPESHTILRENVATLLTQFKPEFVDSLAQLPDDKITDGLNGSYANGPVHMALKLSRDIRQKPYDDAAVLERLDQLDAKLKTATASVIEGSNSYPCKFYIVGSLLKGRFGAESDVDVLCQASPEWMSAHRWTTDHSDVSFQYMDMEKAEERQTYLEAFAPAREVTAEEIQAPGFLTSLYRQGMERKGYALENGHLRQTAPTILREVEVAPAASKHIMWSLPMV